MAHTSASSKKSSKKKNTTKAGSAQKSATKAGSAQKNTKKTASAKKTAANKSAPRAKQPAALLTSEQRRKLLKPRDDFDELAEQIIRTWNNNRALRVPGLSAPRLQSLLKRAKTAAEREQAQREKMERTLRPLYDARLLAEHDLWRAVLDVNAAIKLYARNDPALGETFEFLPAALSPGLSARSGGAEPEQAAPSQEPAETAPGG